MFVFQTVNVKRIICDLGTMLLVAFITAIVSNALIEDMSVMSSLSFSQAHWLRLLSGHFEPLISEWLAWKQTTFTYKMVITTIKGPIILKEAENYHFSNRIQTVPEMFTIISYYVPTKNQITLLPNFVLFLVLDLKHISLFWNQHSCVHATTLQNIWWIEFRCSVSE